MKPSPAEPNPDNTPRSPGDHPQRLRRRMLMGGVAAVAVAAGGFAAWRQRRSLGAAHTPEENAFWALSFDTPGGTALPMSGFRGKPLIVNFWATWCPPCVEELPLLDRFHQENRSKGWQVVGLAIDQPTAVRGFLAKTPVAFPVGMAGLGGTDLVRALGNPTGGLPFTLVLGQDGSVRHRKMGQLSTTDLQAWASLG